MEIKIISTEGVSRVDNPTNNYKLFEIFSFIIDEYQEYGSITICWNDSITKYRQEINSNNGGYYKLWITMDNMFKSANYFSKGYGEIKNG
jgi:hypothetical protein